MLTITVALSLSMRLGSGSEVLQKVRPAGRPGRGHVCNGVKSPPKSKSAKQPSRKPDSQRMYLKLLNPTAHHVKPAPPSHRTFDLLGRIRRPGSYVGSSISQSHLSEELKQSHQQHVLQRTRDPVSAPKPVAGEGGRAKRLPKRDLAASSGGCF